MKLITKSSIFLLSIFTFFAQITAAEHSCDILKTPKDDCGNVCGVINPNVSDSKCGNNDKRKDLFLVIYEDAEKDAEKTEYFESLGYECVQNCSENYKIYKTTNLCVKDSELFEKFEAECNSTKDNNSEPSNLWQIIVGVGSCFIVAALVILAYIKGLFDKFLPKKSPPVNADEDAKAAIPLTNPTTQVNIKIVNQNQNITNT